MSNRLGPTSRDMIAVAESAGVVLERPARTAVHEAAAVIGSTGQPGRLKIALIRSGWSLNSAFYPAEVLKRDGAKAWPAGKTLCYIDHATDAEEEDYPSGSIKNLAAVLTTDAQWNDATQCLEAEVRLFAPWREAITDMAEHIGMSIRAWVYGEDGEAEGRTGFLVTSIAEGRSVDFVTQPAAGGAILAVLESVRRGAVEARNAGHWFEAQIHSSFTSLADRQFGEGYLTREERITLSGAVGDALSAFAARVEAEAPHLYERDPWQEPNVPATPDPMAETAAEPADSSAEAAAPHGEPIADVTDGTPPTVTDPPIEAEEETGMSGTQTGAPPVQAGTAPVVDTPPTTPTIEAPSAANAAVIAAMEAMTTRLTTLTEGLAAVTARADASDAENQRLRNRNTAREAVTAALAAPEVPADLREQIAPRVTATVLQGVYPTDANGNVDPAALGEAITAAITAESGYAARLLESAGVGRPRGLGASAPKTQTVGEFEAKLAEGFQALGLNPEAAKIAAQGRG